MATKLHPGGEKFLGQEDWSGPSRLRQQACVVNRFHVAVSALIGSLAVLMAGCGENTQVGLIEITHFAYNNGRSAR